MRVWILLAIGIARAFAADLEGRVVEDSSATPLASVELRVHKAGAAELAADLDTDRQGKFSVTGLAAGDYTVEARKANYLSTTFHAHVPSAPLSLRLVHFGVIDGQATDTQGRHLIGIVRGPGGRTTGSSRVTVMTRTGEDFQKFKDMPLDEDGHYRFFDLPPGNYAVAFWYQGLNEGSGMQFYPDNAHPRMFDVTGGEEFTGINFTVVPTPSASVSGKVAAPEGFKSQFQLALGMPEHPTLPIGQTLSNDDGTFRFDKVPPGVYDLYASGPVGGYGAFESILQDKQEPLFGHIRVQVSGQNAENIDVPLSPARSFNVVLKAHGSDAYPEVCPKSAQLTLTALDPWAIMFFQNVQAAVGKEQPVKNLPPGRFRLTAKQLGAGCFQLSEPVVDLSGDVSAAVAIEVAAAGSVQGSSKSGPIVLMSLSGEPQTRMAFPDASGHFTLEGLPPGKYRIGTTEINVAGGAVTNVELPEAPK